MKMQLSAIIGCSPGFPGDWRHRLPSGSGGCTQQGRAGLPTPGLWGAPRRPATGPPRPEPPWVQQPRVARQGAAPSPAPGDAGSPPCCFRGGEQPQEGGGKGAGAARDKPHGARIWANGPAVSGGCAPCWGFSFAACTKGWGSPPGARSVPTERGKGASRMGTWLQPCPAARGGETWPCLASPHIPHRPPLPTRGAWRVGFSIPSYGHGVMGTGGGEGALGAMEHGPRSLPELGTWSPAPCGAGATGCGTDGAGAEGRQRVALLVSPAHSQDPALPHRWPWARCPLGQTGQPGGAPGGRMPPFGQGCHLPAAARGIHIPKHILHSSEGAAVTSPP